MQGQSQMVSCPLLHPNSSFLPLHRTIGPSRSFQTSPMVALQATSALSHCLFWATLSMNQLFAALMKQQRQSLLSRGQKTFTMRRLLVSDWLPLKQALGQH